MLHSLKERFGWYSNQNSSFVPPRESARALSHRHGYPGQVHPADRLGQTVATGPGCLATSHPCRPGAALLRSVSLLGSASGRKSLDRSRKLLQFYFFDFWRPRRSSPPAHALEKRPLLGWFRQPQVASLLTGHGASQAA